MSRRSVFPVWEMAMVVVASGMTVLGLLPLTALALRPALRPVVLGVCLLWTLVRLWDFEQALSQWWAWRTSPHWVTTPTQIARAEGVCLGLAFRWQGQHVQQLEDVARQEGALPLGRGPRGGYPALHAVGQAEEQPLLLPWDLLTRHLSLLGTTGSGKSRELEVLIAQAIGE